MSPSPDGGYAWHVVCTCGNIVLVKKRHDYSKLPCSVCRAQQGIQKNPDDPVEIPYSLRCALGLNSYPPRPLKYSDGAVCCRRCNNKKERWLP